MVKTGKQQPDGPKSKVQAQGITSGLARLGVFVGVTGALFYGVLSLVQPQYKSQTQLLIERDGGRAHQDKKFMAGEIRTLRSKRLVSDFIKSHKLVDDAEFNGVLARKGPMKRLSIMLGFTPNPAKTPQNKRVHDALLERISIKKTRDPQIIKIAMRTSSPAKSAKLANDYASLYVSGLNTRTLNTKKTGVTGKPNSTAIKSLRTRIAAGEASLGELKADLLANPVKVPQQEPIAPIQRARSGDVTSNNNDVELGKEQLSKLISAHILARADREEAELRAKLVRDMLGSTGELRSTSTVLNSGLIERLLIKRSRMERAVADLEVTLLPSHPQLKRLKREMTALQLQVKNEARKAAANLDDEAKLAAAREASLKSSIAELKNAPADFARQDQGREEVQISQEIDPIPFDKRPGRISEIERSIANNRQMLVAALAALEASRQRETISIQPLIKATIVSRAVAVSVPVFPKKNPITLLGMVAAFCLGLIALLFDHKRAPRQGHKRSQSSPSSSQKDKQSGAPKAKPASVGGGFGTKPVRT